MVLIRTPPSQRIYPLWNTQALADAIAKATGATNFGTYLGHSPTAERAIDAFTTIPMPRSNRVLGDAIALFVFDKMPNGVSVWDYFGIRYIIWRQRINYNDGVGWRAMENRGDDTQNHFDHDHISTNVIPRPTTTPAPPVTIIGGMDMLVLNVKSTGIFLLRGDQVIHLGAVDHVLYWVRAGVPYQDKVEMPLDVFRQYTGWSPMRGLAGDEISYEEIKAGVDEAMKKVYDEYVMSLQIK